MKHGFEIIDFHTHPFLNSSYNICSHKEVLPNYTPIEDIAEFEDVANAAWYFGSVQSFYRAFKKRYGISPEQYRKEFFAD